MALFPINATLIFTIPSGIITVDPATGNAVQNTIAFTVEASLRSPSKGSFTDIPGIDPSSTYLEGRSIVPKFLPITIVPGMKAVATITDPATGNIMTGEFTLDPTIASRYKAVTKALGSQICGTFIKTGG